MLFPMTKSNHGRTRKVTTNRTSADDGPVTVMAAAPERGYRIPPPPPGFVAQTSGNFRTTGKFAGDMTRVDPPRRLDFFDVLEQRAKTNPACTIRPVEQMGLDDLDDKICDLCVDGRFHEHRM